MTPDDSRHGSRAGYVAGCADNCCRPHHLRYQKMSSLRRLQEGAQRIPGTQVREVLDRWALQGVTPYAIAVAAGICDSTLDELHNGRRDQILRSTAQKVINVTEHDLDPYSKVFADLTRQRAYSLMAAGFTLTWISQHAPGISPTGKWRTEDKVQVRVARSVRDLYQTAPLSGPSKMTAGKAKANGHRHPLAWDDPSTLAWPTGKPEHTAVGAHRARKTDVDHAVIERVLSGDRLPMTTAERREVVARARAKGWSLLQIEERCGISKPERIVAEMAEAS